MNSIVESKIFRKLYRLFLSPLITADPAPVEALLSLTALWWMIVLLFTDAFKGAPFNQVLMAHASQMTWAAIFAITGLGIIISRMFMIRRIERWFVFFSAGLWSFVACILIRIHPVTFPSGMYALLALIAVWAFVRLGYE